MSTDSRMIVGLDDAGALNAARVAANSLQTALSHRIAGERELIDRLITCEIWEYSNRTFVDSNPIVLKSVPGVLGRVQVLTADAGVVCTFFDNATLGSGTILGIVPCDTIGTQWVFGREAVNGITAVFTGGADPKTAVLAIGTL
ncbi:MAG TPA: hypothetical protein VLH09_04705 [Bryobacteraceae bacterium]|nr:hypothetical protein [Bryobacteraceae bacterium]